MSKAIDRAYVDLVCDSPFFATLLLNLERVVDNKGTMWTDGRRIGINPAFAEEIGRECSKGVLAHEALHVTFKHHLRRGGRDMKRWNIACDAAINGVVLDAGFSLPKGGIPPIRGKTAEQIYAEMPPENKPTGGEQGQPQGGNGDGDATQPAWGEVRDGTNPNGEKMSQTDKERADKNTDIIIKQAATAAKRAGKLPAGLEQLIEELTEPKVDWREVLARFIGERARNDYSWREPNRRYIQQGIILPSLTSEGIGKVVMAADTSGSMYGTVSEVCSEIIGAMQVYEEQGQQSEMTVIWCDTEATEQVIADASDLKPVGGGGTEFGPVFDVVRERHSDVKAVVYITDGDCDAFGKEPPCPVLWVLTEKNRNFKPPFGETITINK